MDCRNLISGKVCFNIKKKLFCIVQTILPLTFGLMSAEYFLQQNGLFFTITISISNVNFTLDSKISKIKDSMSLISQKEYCCFYIISCLFYFCNVSMSLLIFMDILAPVRVFFYVLT